MLATSWRETVWQQAVRLLPPATDKRQPRPATRPDFGLDALDLVELVQVEQHSIGHRNPQGLAIHPTTGEVWQSEHGPRGGDELNRLQAGANYGWPTIGYGLEYSGQPVGSGRTQRQGLEQPVYYWDPVVSPSGMAFYTGNCIAEWQNNLFIGALSGQHLLRLVIDNNRVVGEERLLASEGQRFRDVTQGTDGALYTVTDQGRLYRLDRP
ncbi:hypothetical protein EAH73_12485 [Hymenobacter nivis]|uniref:Glucose/Sorbosone dehydrogenase domain-containing protein n=1 Tax=Hymenobacter nivis TaxID=1850093 RepID=A0A502GSX1_9BACT|nr:hypothetical protein EAH73_12485 [Hymenobacter nivis]